MHFRGSKVSKVEAGKFLSKPVISEKYLNNYKYR